MRLVALIAAAALIGLGAAADGKSGKTLKSAPAAPLEATDASLVPAAVPPGHEAGIYRHGATYTVLTGETAFACEAACGDDGVCHAWSFVDAYGSSGARCELKRGGGKPEQNLLATSGVSPRLDAVIWGTDAPPAPAESDQLVGEAEAEPAEAPTAG